MSDKNAVIRDVMATLEREPKIDVHHYPISLDFDSGILTLEGQVKDIAAKKLALELGAAVASVTGIVDRLKVAAAEHMTDEVMREHIRDVLLQESALNDCAVRLCQGDRVDVIREPPADSRGAIEVTVQDGDVLLEGQVPSLSHKRLTGVLAWWIPGTQNVLNCLIVEPPEEDSDAEIIDALRLVLEKDPFVNADQIRVRANDRTVTLEGLVSNETESEMAEHDAWYLFGVDKVINKLEARE
ncbi:MAG TPA: BON domain-containing protein [Pyrinomonadaceae bacterium]|nr:BON domain-containing protein [Pyrinomonadaceae bacterium]